MLYHLVYLKVYHSNAKLYLLIFRKVLKKRREHEYKIRRRTKELKEYIEYIEVI